jgi:hypothetical protein
MEKEPLPQRIVRVMSREVITYLVFGAAGMFAFLFLIFLDSLITFPPLQWLVFGFQFSQMAFLSLGNVFAHPVILLYSIPFAMFLFFLIFVLLVRNRKDRNTLIGAYVLVFLILLLLTGYILNQAMIEASKGTFQAVVGR